MRLVTVVSVGVYVFTCLLQATLVGAIALSGDGRRVVTAALLSALALALHCWHLRFGLRGRRPPHGLATLAALVGVVVVGQAVIGDAWAWTLALVAASAVLVLPRAAGLAALLVAVVTVYVLQPYDSGLFYALGAGYRAILFVSVAWFVAAVTQLDQLRTELARNALSDERARVGARVATTLGDQLVGLRSAAGRARALLDAERDSEVAPALQALAADARTVLDETRRIVIDLRGEGARGELRAARALLTQGDGDRA